MKHELHCHEVFELELRTSHMIILKLDTVRDRIHTLSAQSHHYDQSNHRTDGALSRLSHNASAFYHDMAHYYKHLLKDPLLDVIQPVMV